MTTLQPALAAGVQHALGRLPHLVIEHRSPQLPRHFDGGDGLGRDAFAPTGEAQPLGRRGLHAHSVTVDAGDARDALDHGLAMRADARRLADQREIEMHDAPAGRCQQLDGVAQEAVGRGAAPLRIGRREMLADVAGADRAQHRVGQRMQRHVGVGMPGERLAVRDGDAAQHHGVARAEAVHVEAEGRARFHGRRACRRSSAVVILRLSSWPATMTTLQAGAFGDRRIVGERRGFARRRATPRRDAPRAGRRSGRPAASGRATGRRAAPSRRWRRRRRRVFRVSASGTPRTAPSTPGAAAASRQAVISARPDEGAGGVVNGDEVRRLRRPALPGRSAPTAGGSRRLRPAAAGRGPRRPPVVRFVAGADHDLDPVDARASPGRPPGCGAGPVGRPKGHIAWAEDRRSGFPGRQRRSGRYKSARGVR